MKSSDAVIIGGGIIGLSLALSLRKQGLSVLVIDRTEPGREASWAAAGMIAEYDPHLKSALLPLARASAEMYPEFVRELEEESQLRIDFRQNGTIWFSDGTLRPHSLNCRPIEPQEKLSELEPRLSFRPGAWLLPESSVDPRTLLPALIAAARNREIEVAKGAAAISVDVVDGGVTAVHTERATYGCGLVVNCTGAWASQVAPIKFPTRPVKGHMLSIVFPDHAPGQTAHGLPLLQHVVRAPDVYIVPRSDAKLVIGSTSEEAGFDKHVDTDTIQRLHQAAANLVPEIGEGRILEAWTGLRPGTPDGLPILGSTDVSGYFVATGHFRDGIMLAPITAEVMTEVVLGRKPQFDLEPFSSERFQES